MISESKLVKIEFTTKIFVGTNLTTFEKTQCQILKVKYTDMQGFSMPSANVNYFNFSLVEVFFQRSHFLFFSSLCDQHFFDNVRDN